MEKIEPFSKLMSNAPELVSEKLYYCPKCMEHGYHFYIHQLADIRICPFHEGVKLRKDITQTYVWGESRRFEYDHNDDYYNRRLVFSIFDKKTCDFDNEIMGRLPTEWHTPHDLFNKMSSSGIYSDYDSIMIAASDIEFRNTDISGGKLFIEANRRNPFIVIHDVKALDGLAYITFAKSIQKMNLKNLYIYDIDPERLQYLQYAGELTLLILAREFMAGFSVEEIRLAEGNLITGGTVDFRDEIGAKTLFLWEYIHSRLFHEFLTIDDYYQLGEYKASYQLGEYKASYRPKRFCVDEILSSGIWFNYGLSVFMHVLKDHMRSCFNEFMRFLIHDPEYRKTGLGFNDEYDLLKTPTYIAEKKKDVINIYKA